MTYRGQKKGPKPRTQPTRPRETRPSPGPPTDAQVWAWRILRRAPRPPYLVVWTDEERAWAAELAADGMLTPSAVLPDHYRPTARLCDRLGFTALVAENVVGSAAKLAYAKRLGSRWWPDAQERARDFRGLT
jgi:hypothetical protein